MKKKVLFMVINMNIGGTEKALLNMIDAMPEDRYDITILMLEEYGGFLEFIPKRVRVIQLSGYESIKSLINFPPKQILIRTLKNKRVTEFFRLFWCYFLSAIKKDRSTLFKYLMKRIPFHSDDYDIAIAYAGPMDFISYFILRRVKSKKKIQWIHFDITKIGFNKKFALNKYSEFDDLYAVSSEAKNKLVSILPCLSNKVKVFHNIVSPDKVLEEARIGQGFTDAFNGIRILTVGRLSKEKGQDLAIRVMANLKKSGFNVRWYLLGEGSSRNEYEKLINNYNLTQDVILLGSKSNPYPFMRQCDIYVQPSRHEGYCITLAEALLFENNVIATNFVGAMEQIQLKQRGIVINFEESELYNALKQLILHDHTARKLNTINVGENRKEIQKVIDVFI